MPNPWEKYAAPAPTAAAAPSGPWAKYGAPPPAAPPEPSAVPSGSDWLHAAGLPGSMAEAELTPKQALQLGAINVLHAADPTYLLRSFAVPMIKEGGRAAKGIWEHGGIPQPMDAVHAASAVNPFAAPIVNQMSELREQGKEGEATAAGVLGAGTLAAGLVAPKVAPPVTRTAIRVANKALTPASVGAAGGGLVAGPIGAAAGAETLPEMFPSWAALAKKGIIPTPEWAAKATAQMNLFKTLGKVSEALPDTASAASHPKTVAAVADAFDALKRFHDVPSFQVQPGPKPPVNLLDQAPTSGGSLRGHQGEFPVVPQEQTAGETSMEGFYGKSPQKSLLKAHERQQASPTFSTAPGQKPAVPTLVPKADMTAEDLRFQDENMADILQATIGQLRRVPGQ